MEVTEVRSNDIREGSKNTIVTKRVGAKFLETVLFLYILYQQRHNKTVLQSSFYLNNI